MQTTNIAQASSGALTAPRGLSGTALKFLALGLMVLDHIHYFFGFTGAVPLLFTQLGRLAAPLFLFCTVEGFAHTRNRRAYFLRMVAIGAPMGALQFFMAYAGVLRRPDGFYPQNGVFLNFILLCIIWQGMDWLRARRFVHGALAAFLPMAWPFLASVLSLQFPALMNPIGLLCYSLLPSWGFIIDGGLFYILQGIAMYALRHHRAAQIGAFVVTELLSCRSRCSGVKASRFRCSLRQPTSGSACLPSSRWRSTTAGAVPATRSSSISSTPPMSTCCMRRRGGYT